MTALPRPLRLFATAAYLALVVVFAALAVQAAVVGLGVGWAVYFGAFAVACLAGAWVLITDTEPTKEEKAWPET